MSSPRTFLPEDGAHHAPARLTPTPHLVASASCLSSPSRAGGEDAAVVATDGQRTLVACALDGMGGMSRGRDAARIAAAAVAERLGPERGRVELGEGGHGEGGHTKGGHSEGRPWGRESLDDQPLLATLDGLRLAHAGILSECPGGGVTAAAAVVDGDELRTVHSGDAEVMVLSSTGDLRYRTPAHSPVGRALQLGVLDEDSALLHPERHLVSNGLGVTRMALHLGPRIRLEEGDTVLVASDGVTDNARVPEIVECLSRGDLVLGSTHLVDLCRERMERSMTTRTRTARIGKADDLTLLTIRRR